jgi:hypothetical protein
MNVKHLRNKRSIFQKQKNTIHFEYKSNFKPDK